MRSDTNDSPLAPVTPHAEQLGLSALHTEEGLDRLTSLLANLGNAPFAAFWVVEGDAQFLASVHGGLSRSLPPDAGFARRALLSDQMLVIENAAKDPQLATDPLVQGATGVRFFAGIALRGDDGNRIGVLCLMDTQPQTLSKAGEAALSALAALLEDRLRLRADVLHDPQTGALARRQFADIAGREWRRALRALVPISVIVSELDHIQDFGQREGAAALDRGIRAAALAMHYSLHRPGDVVCRYERTRFVTLLYGTDAPGAAKTAERVRMAVEALGIPYAAGPKKILTLSQGVLTLQPDAFSRIDIEQAISSADEALRVAQARGGNSIHACASTFPAEKEVAV